VGINATREGSGRVLLGSAWMRVGGEAREGEAGSCWLGWGPVSSEGP